MKVQEGVSPDSTLRAQDEGRALFQQAVDAAEKAETKLRTLINASIVEISSGRYGDALAVLNTAAAFLAEVSADWIHGGYHYQRGTAYLSLGGTENLDHALIEYSAASLHLANAGHISWRFALSCRRSTQDDRRNRGRALQR